MTILFSISNPIWPKFGSFPHAKWHHPCLVLLQHHLAGACTQPCQIVPAFLTRGYQRLIAGKMRTIMNLILPAAAFRKILGHFSQSRPWIWGDAQIIRKSPENVISTKRISYRLRNCGNIDPRWSKYLGMPWVCKPGEKTLIILQAHRGRRAALSACRDVLACLPSKFRFLWEAFNNGNWIQQWNGICTYRTASTFYISILSSTILYSIESFRGLEWDESSHHLLQIHWTWHIQRSIIYRTTRTKKEYFRGHDVGQEHKRVAEDPWSFFFSFWGVDATGSLMQDFQQWPRPTLIPIRHLGGCWVNGDTQVFITGRKPFLPPPHVLHCSTFWMQYLSCGAPTQFRDTFIWWICFSMHFFQNIKDVPIFYMSLYVWARHPHCLCNYRSGLPGGHGHAIGCWCGDSCRWFPELPGKRHRSPFAPGTATAANAVHIAINLGSSVLVGPNNATWNT